MTRLTQVLTAGADGDRVASERMLPLVYEELRRLARDRMLRERGDHTLQATALVSEAYLRLMRDQPGGWANRAHFFAAAAEAMRRILVEHARAKHGPKRDPGGRKLSLDVVDLAAAVDKPDFILALDEAMSRLEIQDPQAARVVRLRYYTGLSIDDVAAVIGVSPRTVKRDWAFARVFLFRLLEGI